MVVVVVVAVVVEEGGVARRARSHLTECINDSSTGILMGRKSGM